MATQMPLVEESSTPAELVLLVENMSESPATEQHIHKWTHRDPVLSAVLEFVRTG